MSNDLIDGNLAYKSAEVAREFNNLNQIDPRLYGMTHALANFTWHAFRKRIVLCDVARYTGRPDSPHFISEANPRSRAVDIRAHHGYWEPDEIRIIKNWIRDNFPRSDMAALEGAIAGWYGAIRHHGAGDDEHLHLTVEQRSQLWKALDVKPPSFSAPDKTSG